MAVKLEHDQSLPYRLETTGETDDKLYRWALPEYVIDRIIALEARCGNYEAALALIAASDRAYPVAIAQAALDWEIRG